VREAEIIITMCTLSALVAADSARRNLLTWAAIGTVACISADMTHEVLGHVVAARLLGVRILSRSMVPIHTANDNRLVAAAGTLANWIVGWWAPMAFSGQRSPRSGRIFSGYSVSPHTARTA